MEWKEKKRESKWERREKVGKEENPLLLTTHEGFNIEDQMLSLEKLNVSLRRFLKDLLQNKDSELSFFYF